MVRVISIIILSLSALGLTKNLAGETFMSAKEAQKKFGKKEFSAPAFKSAQINTRGEMTADLVLKKHLVGKPLSTVTQELGDPDGYYENDQIPAYKISNKPKDIWQVVFIPDSEWKNVSEVLIHKNCCAK